MKDRYAFAVLLASGYDYMLLRAMSPEEREAQVAMVASKGDFSAFKSALNELNVSDKTVLEVLRAQPNSPSADKAHKDMAKLKKEA